MKSRTAFPGDQILALNVFFQSKIEFRPRACNRVAHLIAAKDANGRRSCPALMDTCVPSKKTSYRMSKMDEIVIHVNDKKTLKTRIGIEGTHNYPKVK